ncbi:MAG: 50S ribosomal protein L29 [Proteobacteria bacterium]|nr:50S ribosomal protein L29 [Pseudomonadota bacterium]
MSYNMMSKELRNLNISDLEKLITDKKSEILETSKKVAKGSEKNVKKINNLKKELARMLTILNELKIIGDLKNE